MFYVSCLPCHFILNMLRPQFIKEDKKYVFKTYGCILAKKGKGVRDFRFLMMSRQNKDQHSGLQFIIHLLKK